MLTKLTIRDLSLRGRRLFIRVDFNVPMNENQEITDDTRIRESIPTIRHAVEHGARLILASHLGRPKGKVVPQMSLAPAAKRLSELLGKPVRMAEDCIGPDVERTVASLSDGEILMLENLRFHIEEEKNEPGFAKALAGLCEVYVNDAFGTAHRAHASTEGITHHVTQSAAGFLMEKELEYLGTAVKNPAHPYIVVLGGAKVSTKLELIENLLQVADRILIGGGMSFTFLKALGKEIGGSLLEAEMVGQAADYLEKARKMGKAIDLPVDVVAAAAFSNDADHRIVSIDEIPAGWMGLDIGPKTIEVWKEQIMAAKTVLLNGPMGAFEMPNFSLGTNAVIRSIAASPCVSIVGGGDTVAALDAADLHHAMSHVSTGGGASLEFLGGRTLPGLEALTDRKG